MESLTYHIQADWDPDAGVWVATSGDVPGLATEAKTIEDLTNRLRIMIPELLEANGLLPWQIGVYSAKLTEAMQSGKWEDAKLYAAVLASYVAAAHDPFNTTDNFDGHLSAQNGVNDRFGTALVDRYSSFFFMRPNDANVLYNAACTYGILGMKIDALEHFRRSVNAGYSNLDWCLKDPDLKILYDEPEFKNLIANRDAKDL